MIRFLGIYREPICSPGRHRENDTVILELVADALEASAHHVALASMDDAPRFGRDAAVVFSMSRAPRALDLLTRWVGEGRTVVNQPQAVLATARSCLAGRTLGAVALPPARVVPTSPERRPEIGQPIDIGEWWVKGGDLYASRREDVQRVHTMEALGHVLDDFNRRGLSTAVLQQHVAGREIKFYAVGSSTFFHAIDVEETASPSAAHDGFHQRATAAGLALDLEIFGGDVVVGADGSITLIDLNDWPSFAPCREPAAKAIAGYLEARSIGITRDAGHIQHRVAE